MRLILSYALLSRIIRGSASGSWFKDDNLGMGNEDVDAEHNQS